MKAKLTLLTLIAGLLVVANGVVAFCLRYNFMTQEQYGVSLEPVYIMGGGIAILIVWLGPRTTKII